MFQTIRNRHSLPVACVLVHQQLQRVDLVLRKQPSLPTSFAMCLKTLIVNQLLRAYAKKQLLCAKISQCTEKIKYCLNTCILADKASFGSVKQYRGIQQELSAGQDAWIAVAI